MQHRCCWGAASATEAIDQVEAGDARYFIQWGNGETVDVAVTNHDGAKSLCTDPDDVAANLLDAVPTIGSVG